MNQHSTILTQSICPEGMPGMGSACWNWRILAEEGLTVRLTSLQTLQLLLHPQENPLCICIGEAIDPASCGIPQTCK